MNVLSLFNGMSVCNMALEDAGITVDKMYISEIDKYANQASEVLFPDQIQLGSVCDWHTWDIDWSSIDLVTGGFPCQAWSMAGKQQGDKDERGMLFWTMLDIMVMVKYSNPNAHFIIENVKMKKEFEQYITYHTEQALGDVHKVIINSALVSAQNRNRYYWTSFPVLQPEDEGISLKDIIEREPENITVMSDTFTKRNAHILRDDISGKAKNLSAMEYVENGRQGDYINTNALVFASCSGRNPRIVKRSKSGKANTLTANYYKGLDADSRPGVMDICDDKKTYRDAVKSTYRKLTPRECMRLQTIPERYIDKLLESGISNTQLYKMTGNGWTMKVINHIISEMLTL